MDRVYASGMLGAFMGSLLPVNTQAVQDLLPYFIVVSVAIATLSDEGPLHWRIMRGLGSVMIGLVLSNVTRAYLM